ncbi:hypothetical protein [Streptomyces sp. NPDC046182]|uniref:ISAzo13-like element transposase-related protein n=1 Tax=Streptomyces sp. NPDC046182 TaxID=3154601 RepID=UPI0033C723EB
MRRCRGSTATDAPTGLLRKEGFSLQADVKTIGATQHLDTVMPDSVTSTSRHVIHRDAGDPVNMVDTRKKELVGEYKNAEHEWRPARQPVKVHTHDCPGQAQKATPHGIYASRHDYPRARRLLIIADPRTRARAGVRRCQGGRRRARRGQAGRRMARGHRPARTGRWI